jgi:hypothetical protein
MRGALIVQWGIWVCLAGWTHAQSVPAQSEASALLRLERSHFLESTCVLLNADGRYHLERHAPRKVRVFEGHLDQIELREIVGILSEDVLLHLEQKSIPDLMMKADDDRVILEIHRPQSWQQLLFPDSLSREPFREVMGPLLKFLESANKKKIREFSEEAGRNNCLPPSSTEFAKRPVHQTAESRTLRPGNDPMTAGEIPSARQPQFTLLMYETRMFGYQPRVSCLLVSTTGGYHMVTQSKTTDKGMTSAVLDGTLTASQFAALRAVLDSPEIVRQPEEQHIGEIMMTGDGYFTRLYIPRGNLTQNFAAWKSYRIINQVMSRSVEDHGTRILAPVRDWLGSSIEEKRSVPVAIPANPRCLPGN